MLLFPFLIQHLGQSPQNYFDVVAFIIVWGGTTIVAVTLLPWEYRGHLLKVFFMLFKPEKYKYSHVLKLMQQAFIEKKVTVSKRPDLYERIIVQGLEYLQLGLDKDRILRILEDQIALEGRRMKRIGLTIRNLAKYPPAFGLIGTVFGLVNIMRQLEGVTEASRLGAEMSIALVATMYGLLVANFIINPLGEFILKKIEEQEEYADIALEAIGLMTENASQLEFHEQLNALVPVQLRMSLKTSEIEGEAA